MTKRGREGVGERKGGGGGGERKGRLRMISKDKLTFVLGQFFGKRLLSYLPVV